MKVPTSLTIIKQLKRNHQKKWCLIGLLTLPAFGFSSHGYLDSSSSNAVGQASNSKYHNDHRYTLTAANILIRELM